MEVFYFVYYVVCMIGMLVIDVLRLDLNFFVNRLRDILGLMFGELSF